MTTATAVDPARLLEAVDPAGLAPSAAAALDRLVADVARQPARPFAGALVAGYLGELVAQATAPPGPAPTAAARVAVVVAGRPRTGTTALRAALALRLGTRSLRAWEAHGSFRPGAGGAADARRFTARRAALQRRLSPDLAERYPVEVDEAEEEMVLAETTLRSPLLGVKLGLDRYWDEVAAVADPSGPALVLARLARLAADDATDRPWLVKCPLFTVHAAELWVPAFAGATWITIERRDDHVRASMAALLRSVRRSLGLEPTDDQLASLVDRIDAACRRGEAELRQALPADRLLALDHDRLRSDPDGTLDDLVLRLRGAGAGPA